MEQLQLLTKKDLAEFKEEIITEIRKLLSPVPNDGQLKWLKTYDVKKMLGISSGTLQTMRDKGIISFTKKRGLCFYKREDVIKFMEENKQEGFNDVYAKFMIKRF